MKCRQNTIRIDGDLKGKGSEMTQKPMNNHDDNDQSSIDARWVVEAELRLDAYNESKLRAMCISKVFKECENVNKVDF